jgi:Transglycosylase SLT domain
MRALVRLLWLALLLLPPAALAQRNGEPSPSQMCEAAISSAEYADRLPAHLLGAIARVESGRPDPRTGRLAPWPWTINAEGIGAFFPTKAAAIAAVQQLQARGVRSIDVGCLQINLMFHPNAFASLDEAFDPRANALYAAHFLNELRAGTHDWLQAIADYHSQAPVLGKDYRNRVVALWHDPALSGWGLGLATAYQDFIPTGRVYADFAGSSHAYAAFATSNPALAYNPRR